MRRLFPLLVLFVTFFFFVSDVKALNPDDSPPIIQLLFCDSASGDPTEDPSSEQLFTGIGCIPAGDPMALIVFMLPLGIGIAGGAAFLMVVVAVIRIKTSAGDPERLNSAKQLLYAALSGLALLIFAMFVYRLIGVEILHLPGL
ncbi:hypothetical protein ACFL2C_02880 [Patescibacteria group bacterium]